MKNRTEQSYSVDGLMRNVACTLVSDFRVALNDPSFCSDFYVAIKSNEVTGIRHAIPAVSETMDVPYYKASYQVASLLKRYRFEKDLFSDAELIKKAITTFHETQHRVRAVNFTQLSAFTNCVVEYARAYIAEVLGVYSDEEHRSLCRFGRRASVGIPARLACEAERWQIPLSGSQNQIDWFDSEMSQIPCVVEYFNAQKGSDLKRSTYQPIDSLTLTLVPKTFKSFRSIMPNTTIGTYMSYGLGEMLRLRLKGVGYDIRSLQETHKYLARRGSVHSMYTTADLSSASDSISVALVDALFPADWVEILKKSRIGTIKLPDDTVLESETFCTMGIGYTFPLQTLVFLSLLKALSVMQYGPRSLRTISVYGDDMIYPSSMHGSVVKAFEELGFVINVDKTFFTGHFRESCGGDYYHGVDVRPFQPRNDSANVGRKTYEAVLYKYVNGLLARWSEYEITETLRFLLSEIGRVTGKAKLCPGDYPDDSGIKVSSLSLPYSFLKGRTDVAWPKHIGHGVFRFSFLRLVTDKREEKRHVPYLWSALRDEFDNRYCKIGWKSRPGRTFPVERFITTSLRIGVYEPPLIWAEVQPICFTRSKATGKRHRRLAAHVTVSHTGRYTRQSGTSCFGVPQI
jgi:hypothetical protein